MITTRKFISQNLKSKNETKMRDNLQFIELKNMPLIEEQGRNMPCSFFMGVHKKVDYNQYIYRTVTISKKICSAKCRTYFFILLLLQLLLHFFLEYPLRCS